MADVKPADACPTGTTRRPPARGLRRFLVAFKWCRITLLLLIFVIIILGLFLNHVGLPDWVETRLQRQLQEHGWDVDYSRLRLRWYHGVVAEGLRMWRTNTTTGPHLFLHRAEFRPNWKALLDFRLEFEGVSLEDGRLIWPLAGTNQPQRTLVLNGLSGELIFRPGDQWELKHFEATCLGALVRFRGDITNASLIHAWKLPHVPTQAGAPPGQTAHRVLTELSRLRLAGQPAAQVIFAGDARDWRAFDITVRLTAPGVSSPWGGGTNVTAIARTIPPPTTNDPIRLSLHVSADDSRTRWAEATRMELQLQLEPSLEHLLPTNALLSARLVNATARWGRARLLSMSARCQPEGPHSENRTTRLDVQGEQLETRWGNAARLDATIVAEHGGTNYLPARATVSLEANDLRTPWITSRWSRAESRLDLPPASQLTLFASNQLWLDRITNLPFHLTASVSNAVTAGILLDRAITTVDWRAPHARASAELVSGEASVTAEVTGHAETGEITFTNSASLRPVSFARFLTTNAQHWLETFTTERPPSLINRGRLVFPTWAQWPTNWQGDVLPSMQMEGQLNAAAASYRGVEFTRAHIPFSLTNRVWELTDLRMDRPEGSLRLNARADEITGEFQIDLQSEINPLNLQPALTNIAPVFKMFAFSNLPPRLEARLAGNRRDLSTLHGSGQVVVTNVVFRGVPIQGVTAELAYSNRWLSILHPVVIRPGERGRADGIGINLSQPRLHLTNATGRISPMAVARAIGPQIERTIKPYVFEQPPRGRVNGSIPLNSAGQGTEDMRFEVDGGEFHWNVLHVETAKGLVLWQGDRLTLTNLAGRWHGGTYRGWAHFDFDAPRNESMAFDASFTDCDLKPIVRDFQQGQSNKLEGTITGRMRVQQADFSELNSWDGDGHIQLTEGLIWDIPLFGLISPILNTVVPGLGNSRAKRGQATFTMTNSVIHSRDIEIVASATRLRYDGKVDFAGNVSARVEAELMREIPGIGRVISTVFWPVTRLLRYSVSGTLSSPTLEPLNPLSRILTLPLMPLKAINEILTPEKKGTERPKQP